MKILGFTIKNKTWKTFAFALPLTIILFSYQQCSRSCPVEVNREVGSTTVLPFCSIDSTVACVNDFRSCGEHSDSSQWFEDGENLLPKERTCAYGDKVTDQYTEQLEYICKDGTVSPTGATREGPLKTAGQCSDAPFNCGSHLDNTKWWEADSTLQKVPRDCSEEMTEVFNYYKAESEFKCENGKVIPTEQKRLVSLEKVDNCPQENNCGPHTEGSTWYENMGTIQSPRICSDAAKTPVVDIYTRKKELKCDKGTIVDQAVTLVGDLLTYGECPGTVGCGEHHDGETWKVITNEEIGESFVCGDKLTSAESRYQKVQIKQCTNGVVTVKESVKGDLLSIGICPRGGCFPFTDGEKWLADLALEVTQPKECPFGPTTPGPSITYVNLQEAQCFDGKTIPTGYLQRGAKKRETTCYACAPNSKQNCTQANGSGSKMCKADGSGFNSCQVESCNSGFYNKNGVCTPLACTPGTSASCEWSANANARGAKVCNEAGSAYGNCAFEACNSGYIKILGSDQKFTCQKIICTANAYDSAGCASMVDVPGGIYQRQCNGLGTDFMACVLSCKDASAPRDGKCTTYSWAPTSIWSACNADCGGTQTQESVCKNNFGEQVEDAKCSGVKPVNTRACNAKTGTWSEGMEIISPSSRETCPGLYLGYIEKTYQKPINYSCVDNKKVKTLGNTVLLSTNNYCSAIQPARCSHDSLTIVESLGRLAWMKACQSQVPAISTFFDIIGGADQLSKYLNDTSSALYGTNRPRPLYVTFSNQTNQPWIAPKVGPTSGAVANCNVPADVKIFGICTSSCYTPDQRLLFNVAGKQQYIPIIDAITQKQESIMTLAPDSVLEKLKFRTTPIARFVSELVDTNHKIRTFNTVTGGKLAVTFNHPLVASDGVIRDASEFKRGDQLVRADGSFDEISSIVEMVYPGKVHNVLPYGESTLGNIIVSEGFLSGSAYFQNDGVNYMNQQILRSNLLQGVNLQK